MRSSSVRARDGAIFSASWWLSRKVRRDPTFPSTASQISGLSWVRYWFAMVRARPYFLDSASIESRVGELKFWNSSMKKEMV